jgi:multimeric flavodoxin WrbA
MKVLLVNGSPHTAGSTYTALVEVATTLQSEGIETQLFHIGSAPLAGCTACCACQSLGRCIFTDSVNDFLALAREADGFIFGTPVHYASASGALTSFMDRVFFTASCAGLQSFYLKPAAGVIAARRGGSTTTFDHLNKYFGISQMPIISSQYWNMVHGMGSDDVKKDLEGMQTMRTLGRNMAWFLKCKEAAIKAGVAFPHREERIATNFIR